MVWEDLKPSDILTRRSFENALMVHNALAGSTNAMIHLVAMAGRAGIEVNAAGFRRFRAEGAGDRQPAPLGRMADGGFPHRRRHPRPALAPRAPAPSRRAHGGRNAARRARRRRRLQRRRHPPARQADRGLRRHGDPARQPRAERLRDQAAGGGAAPAAAHRPGYRVRHLRRDDEGRERSRSRRHARSHHGVAQCRARSAGRACRNGACCRSRRSS